MNIFEPQQFSITNDPKEDQQKMTPPTNPKAQANDVTVEDVYEDVMGKTNNLSLSITLGTATGEQEQVNDTSEVDLKESINIEVVEQRSTNMEASADLLSFSASLVNILTLLDTVTLARCRRVNKLINYVIARHDDQMHKSLLIVELYVLKDSPAECVVIGIIGRRRYTLVSFHVTNTRIAVQNCVFPEFLDSFGKLIDGVEVDGIVDGLERTLAPLFERHKIYQITLFNKDADNQLTGNCSRAVAKLFQKRSRFKCTTLNTFLSRQLRSIHAKIAPTRGLFFYWSKDCARKLPRLLRYCPLVRMQLPRKPILNKVALMLAVENVIKAWYSADLATIGAFCVEITLLRDHCRLVNLFNSLSAEWTMVEEEKLMEGYPEPVVSLLRRPSDGKLCIALRGVRNFVLYEVVCQGPLTSFQPDTTVLV